MRYVLLLVIVVLAGCGGSSSRPGVFTGPAGWLDSAPLGTPAATMLEQLGPPDTQSTIAGREIWGYKAGTGAGARTFSYEFVDGKLDDARFFDSMANLESAKVRQAAAKAAAAEPKPEPATTSSGKSDRR